MTTTEPKRDPGYPGSLPPRNDTLARPWILIVLGIFVLIIVLSVAAIPSRFIPEPTPLPLPSLTPAPSESPSAEPSDSASAVPSESAAASGSADPSASPGSAEPSASP
jgi:hypothetical protein